MYERCLISQYLKYSQLSMNVSNRFFFTYPGLTLPLNAEFQCFSSYSGTDDLKVENDIVPSPSTSPSCAAALRSSPLSRCLFLTLPFEWAHLLRKFPSWILCYAASFQPRRITDCSASPSEWDCALYITVISKVKCEPL